MDDVLVAAPAEVDLTTAPAMRASLDGAPAAADVVVDMCSTRFMDSSGVHVLVTAYRRQAEAGGHLGVLASRPVHRVLEATGLAELLEISVCN